MGSDSQERRSRDREPGSRPVTHSGRQHTSQDEKKKDELFGPKKSLEFLSKPNSEIVPSRSGPRPRTEGGRASNDGGGKKEENQPPPTRESGRMDHTMAAHGDTFTMSPRTLNQTRKGAPKEFLGAQEVNLGVYDQARLGTLVPRDWDKEPRHRTRTQLLAARRRGMFPDGTFDLDGDGIVSREDLALSLRHDYDKDKRLNTTEKQGALRELRSNDPKIKFDSLRPITAPHRLDSAGWPVYGEREDDVQKVTRTQLLQKRRKDMLEHNRSGYHKYEDAVSKLVPPWLSSAERAESLASAAAVVPPKKVRSQQIEEHRRKTRRDAGLEETMTSLNPSRNSLDPVAHVSGQVRYEDQHHFSLLGYRDAPPHQTRSGLQGVRHQTMLEELDRGVKSVEATFKPTVQRLKEREDQLFLQGQLAMSDPTNRVRSHLLSQRREHNTSQLISLWGAEKEPVMNAIRAVSPSSRPPFWTLKDNYNPDPAQQSNMDLTQSFKWYKKIPEYYLEKPPPTWGEGGRVDPYDRPHHPGPDTGPNSVAVAPNIATSGSTVAMLDQTMRGSYVPRPAVRPEIRRDDPSSAKAPEYLTEEAKLAEDQRVLSVPLYSSFSPGGVFGPRSLPSASGQRVKEKAQVQQDLDEVDNDILEQRRTELGPPMKMQEFIRQSRDQTAPKQLARASSFLDAEGQLSPSTQQQESPPTPPPAAKSLLDRGTKVRSGGFLDSKVRPVTTGLNRPWP